MFVVLRETTNALDNDMKNSRLLFGYFFVSIC